MHRQIDFDGVVTHIATPEIFGITNSGVVLKLADIANSEFRIKLASFKVSAELELQYNGDFSLFGSESRYNVLLETNYTTPPAVGAEIIPGEDMTVGEELAWWTGALAAWQSIYAQSDAIAVSDRTGNGNTATITSSWDPSKGWTSVYSVATASAVQLPAAGTTGYVVVWVGKLISTSSTTTCAFVGNPVTVPNNAFAGSICSSVAGEHKISIGHNTLWSSALSYTAATADSSVFDKLAIFAYKKKPDHSQELWCNGKLLAYGAGTTYTNLNFSGFTTSLAGQCAAVAVFPTASIDVQELTNTMHKALFPKSVQGWWDGAIAAWQSKGAADAEDAKVDRTGNGYNLTISATWDAEDGWTTFARTNAFNGFLPAAETTGYTFVWAGKLISSGTNYSIVAGITSEDWIGKFSAVSYTNNTDSFPAYGVQMGHNSLASSKIIVGTTEGSKIIGKSCILVYKKKPDNSQEMWCDGNLVASTDGTTYNNLTFDFATNGAKQMLACAVFPTSDIDIPALTTKMAEALGKNDKGDWWHGAIAAYEPVSAVSLEDSKRDVSGNANHGAQTCVWKQGIGWTSATTALTVTDGIPISGTTGYVAVWCGKLKILSAVPTTPVHCCFGSTSTWTDLYFTTYYNNTPDYPLCRISIGHTTAGLTSAIRITDPSRFARHCIFVFKKKIDGSQEFWCDGELIGSNVGGPYTVRNWFVFANGGGQCSAAALFRTEDIDVVELTAKIRAKIFPEVKPGWWDGATAAWQPIWAENEVEGKRDLTGNGRDLVVASSWKRAAGLVTPSVYADAIQLLLSPSFTAVWCGSLSPSENVADWCFISWGSVTGSLTSITSLRLQSSTDYRLYASQMPVPSVTYRFSVTGVEYSDLNIIIFQWDSSTATQRLYVNGVLFGTNTGSPAYTETKIHVGMNGAKKFAAAAIFPSGDIDAIELYGKIAEAIYPPKSTDVDWHYGAVAAWKMRGVGDLTEALIDVTGNGHDLVTASTWNSANGLCTFDSMAIPKKILPAVGTGVTIVWYGRNPINVVSRLLWSASDTWAGGIAAYGYTDWKVRFGLNASGDGYNLPCLVLAASSATSPRCWVYQKFPDNSQKLWEDGVLKLSAAGTTYSDRTIGIGSASHGVYAAAIFHTTNIDVPELTAKVIRAADHLRNDGEWYSGAIAAWQSIYSENAETAMKDVTGNGYDLTWAFGSPTWEFDKGWTSYGYSTAMSMLVAATDSTGATFAWRGKLHPTATTHTTGILCFYNSTLSWSGGFVMHSYPDGLLRVGLNTSSGYSIAKATPHNVDCVIVYRKFPNFTQEVYVNGELLATATGTTYSVLDVLLGTGAGCAAAAVYRTSDIDPVALTHRLWSLAPPSKYGELIINGKDKFLQEESTSLCYPLQSSRQDNFKRGSTYIKTLEFLNNLPGYLEYGEFDEEGNLILEGYSNFWGLSKGHNLGIRSVEGFCPPHRIYIKDETTGNWLVHRGIRLVEYSGSVHGDSESVYYVGFGGCWCNLGDNVKGKLVFLNLLGPFKHYEIPFILKTGYSGNFTTSGIPATNTVDPVSTVISQMRSSTTAVYHRQPDYTKLNYPNTQSFAEPGYLATDGHRLRLHISVTSTNCAHDHRWLAPFAVRVVKNSASSPTLYGDTGYNSNYATDVYRAHVVGTIVGMGRVLSVYAGEHNFYSAKIHSNNSVTVIKSVGSSIGYDKCGSYRYNITTSISSSWYIHLITESSDSSAYKTGIPAANSVQGSHSVSTVSINVPDTVAGGLKLTEPEQSDLLTFSVPPVIGFAYSAALSSTTTSNWQMVFCLNIYVDEGLSRANALAYRIGDMEMPMFTVEPIAGSTNNPSFQDSLDVALFTQGTGYARVLGVRITGAGASTPEKTPITMIPIGSYQDYEISFSTENYEIQKKYRFRVATFETSTATEMTYIGPVGAYYDNLNAYSTSVAATLNIRSKLTAAYSGIAAYANYAGLVPANLITMQLSAPEHSAFCTLGTAPTIGTETYTEFPVYPSVGYFPNTKLHRLEWIKTHSNKCTSVVNSLVPNVYRCKWSSAINSSSELRTVQLTYEKYLVLKPDSRIPDWLSPNEPIPLAGHQLVNFIIMNHS